MKLGLLLQGKRDFDFSWLPPRVGDKGIAMVIASLLSQNCGVWDLGLLIKNGFCKRNDVSRWL